MFLIAAFLALAGAALCINMICRASHMPPKSSWTISLLVAGTFAAGVGVVVSALSGDLETSFRFFCGAAVLLLGQVLWGLSKGMSPIHILGHVSGHDANQH